MNKKFFLLFFPLLLLTGCLTMEETITLNTNGTALVRFQFTLSEEKEQMIQAAMHELQPRLPQGMYVWNFLSREDVLKQFNSEQSEVRLYHQLSRDGQKKVKILVFLKSWDELNTGKYGAILCQKESLEVAVPSELATPAGKTALKQIRTICPDLSGTLRVETPEKIKTTTGSSLSGTATEWKFDAASAVPTSILVTW